MNEQKRERKRGFCESEICEVEQVELWKTKDKSRLICVIKILDLES